MIAALTSLAVPTTLKPSKTLGNRTSDLEGLLSRISKFFSKWVGVTSQMGPAIEYQRLELCRTYGPRHGNLNVHAWLSVGLAKTLLAAVRAPRHHPGAAAHLEVP